MNKRRTKKALNKYLDGKPVTWREKEVAQKCIRQIFADVLDALQYEEALIINGTGLGEPRGVFYANQVGLKAEAAG